VAEAKVIAMCLQIKEVWWILAPKTPAGERWLPKALDRVSLASTMEIASKIQSDQGDKKQATRYQRIMRKWAREALRLKTKK
jgi:hypothetical protein